MSTWKAQKANVSLYKRERRGVTRRTTATSFIIHQWLSRIRHVTRWLPCGSDYTVSTHAYDVISQQHARMHTHIRVQIFSFRRTGIISKVDTTYKNTSLNAIFYMTFSEIQPVVQKLKSLSSTRFTRRISNTTDAQLLSTRP